MPKYRLEWYVGWDHEVPSLRTRSFEVKNDEAAHVKAKDVWREIIRKDETATCPNLERYKHIGYVKWPKRSKKK